jgi:hypothetical protein
MAEDLGDARGPQRAREGEAAGGKPGNVPTAKYLVPRSAFRVHEVLGMKYDPQAMAEAQLLETEQGGTGREPADGVGLRAPGRTNVV